MIHRFHTPGLLVAEAVGLTAFAEAFARFIHGPHVFAVCNAVAALLVAIYTHAVRRRVASPPPLPIDHLELARLLAAELRPARPTIHDPAGRPTTLPLEPGPVS